MSTLAIIPARGNSKGIPGKNLKELAGKPMLAWMIEAAKGSRSISDIVVSSDDRNILDVATTYKVDSDLRPDQYATDTASSESVLIDYLKSHKSKYDIVLMLQPTSPLTLSEDIEGVLKALDTPAGMHKPLKFDSAFTVTPFDKFLWHDMGVAKGVVGINHEKRHLREMRQQRYGQFMENGAVYAMRTKEFLKAKNRFCGYSNTYVMPKDRSLEIDDLADWLMAEALLAPRYSNRFVS